MSIPKIIHQTWKSKDVPHQWKAYQQAVIDLHPDWEYRLWTDEDNDQFIAEHYPGLIDTFRSYPKPVMRADVIRYAIMDSIGGLYLDLDYEMIKPFDLEGSVVLPLSRSQSYGDNEKRVGNCIMASSPGHEFWKKVLEEIAMNNQSIGLDELDVEKATGPLLLTRVYNEGIWRDITTPERIYFHPPTPKSEKEYDSICQNGKSYGMHHAHGSWRKSFIKRIVEKIFG